MGQRLDKDQVRPAQYTSGDVRFVPESHLDGVQPSSDEADTTKTSPGEHEQPQYHELNRSDGQLAALTRHLGRDRELLIEWVKMLNEIKKSSEASIAEVDSSMELVKLLIPEHAFEQTQSPMTPGNQAVGRDQIESATREDLQGTTELQRFAAAAMTKQYLDQFNPLPTMDIRGIFACHPLQLREPRTFKCSVCENIYGKIRINSKKAKTYLEQYTKADETEQDMSDGDQSDAKETLSTRPVAICSNPRWSWKCIFPACDFECHLVCVSLITSDLKCTEGKLGNSFSPYLTKLFENQAHFVRGQPRTGGPEEFCYYHGNSFKLDDFINDTYQKIIPAYVVQRHDWTPKSVCPSAAVFLQEVKSEMELKVYNNNYSFK